MNDNGKDGPAEAGLDPMLQAHIGRKLRELYDQTAREPAPERFLKLLEQLETGEKAAPRSDATDGPAAHE
jgi:hypothetical protein